MANLLDEFGLRGAGLGVSTNGNLLDEFGIQKKPATSGIARRLVGDTAISALKSAIAVPETAVGIADLVTGGKAGKFLENEGGIGFRPKEAKETLDEYLSPEQKAANEKLAQADGFVDTLSTAVDNPSTILHTGLESIAPMLAGGVVARGILGATRLGNAGRAASAAKEAATPAMRAAAARNAAAAGAIGEGVVGAGMGAESIRQQTEDGLLTGEQAGLAGLAGVGTGLIGAGGAKIAQKLGIGEIDTLLAGGNAGATTTKGIARKAAEGAVVEGALQELPQSMQEQALQNIALDKPWDEGLGNAAAMGLLTGTALGGIAGPLGGKPMVQPTPTAENPAPAPVPAPDPAAGPISRTAAQLPGPSIAGLLPDPGQTLYGDAAGNLSPDGPSRNVDREYRPTGRERGPQTFGPGMDQAAPRGESAPLEGQLIRGGIGAQPQAGQREPGIYDNEPSLGLPAPGRVIPDMRADNITVAPDGTAVPGKTATPTPTSYVQGGPGMDQQREVGKTYKGLPAANRAIRNAANPEQLEAVKVGPQTFEVRPKAAEPEAPRPVLQNRDRSTPASVTQMRGIAAKPDYQRVSISRDFANGAPVVEPGASVPASRKGRSEVVSTASGRKINAQYAVIEAADLLPSHDINGSQNAEYENGALGKSRAIAGNGRVTGISHAYTQGTAGEYRRELEADAGGHGISPAAIKGMKNPVLVRIMPQDQITQDIGDESNTATVSALSGAEQARNDAKRIDAGSMAFDDNGEISEATVHQFIQAMPEAERSALLDGGRPSRQAYERAASAVFASAYESDELVRLQAQATDPEARTVLAGLLAAASKMARLKGQGQWDIRGLVVEAAQAAVNATRNGQTLAAYAQQLDIERNPEATYFIDLFAANSRSGKRIGEELSAVADTFYAEASKSETDMFGAVPRRSRQEILGELNGAAEGQPGSAQPTGQQAGPAAIEASGPAAAANDSEQASAGGNAQAETFQLNQQTEEELAAADAANKARIKAEEKAQAEADEKRRKEEERAQIKAQSEAQADNFTLGVSGEDALSGQTGMFDSQPSLSELGSRPAATQAAAEEAPATADPLGSKRQPIRFTADQPAGDYLADGSIIEDGQGQQYRVHYQRNDLVVAHPIVDGKAQVNAESSVRFHVGDPASADGRRTDPIYLVEGRNQPAPKKKPRGAQAKKSEAEAKARADYFTPGNVVKSYGGNDRVISYSPPDEQGRWSVTVRAVEKDGDTWKDKPNERERTHSTAPDARELKAGPTGKVEQVELPTAVQPEGVDQSEAEAQTDRERSESTSSESDQPAAAPPAAGAGRRAAAIEDAGEKLGGARKDQLRTVRDRLDDMGDEEIAGSSLSQLWPKGELDKISDPFEAALYHVVRGLIPAKPRVSYRVKAWVGKVKAARDILTTLGGIGANATAEKMRAYSPGLGIVADQIEVLMALDRKQWGRIDNIRRAHGRYNQDGEMVPGSWVSLNIDGRQVSFYGHDSVASAIPAIKDRVEGKDAPEKRMKFAIYTDRQTSDVFVVKEGDAEMRRLKTFKGVKEARAFLNDEYEAAVALWDAVKNRDNVTKSDMRRSTNDPRVGQDHRNGKDVTPEQFIESFGFRGVEFGNWVKQGAGGRERQGMLNDAYDAFMDLAGILNIPPKALSLEGKLGIGFGSRGSGKASAHYEPDLVVINMTKTKGAGTLAHEWFHALDNYFARRRAEQPGSGIAMTDRETAYITYRPERLWVNKKHPSMRMTRSELSRYQTNHPGAPLYQEGNWEPDAKHPNGVRPQVEKAFAELVATLNASPMLQRAKVIDGKTSDGYWSRIIERGARSFETYVIARLADQGFRNDYLANVQTLEQFARDPGRYPYLTPDEQGPVNEAFDKLFATLETKETDLGIALFSRASGPVDPAGLSESSVVTGKVPENPISLEEAISAAEQFLADYNGNIELSYRIRKKQDELYGPGSIAKIGVIKGAYHPGRGLFTLAADHLSSAADAYETLRHEILGHYGLDTFSPQDKQALLDKILASKDDPSLKLIWDDIAVLYKDKSQNVQAEEVFARLAESTRSGKEKLADLIGSLLTRLLRKVLGYKKGVITRRELLREIEVISKGIRNGSRQRQTFESETKQRRGAQTETPAFKRWFGDSKVVDADGKPLVVYHGTNAEFFEFRPSKTGNFGEGVYFADAGSDAASVYGDRVISVYLSLQNPWVVAADYESDAVYSEDVDNPAVDAVLTLKDGRRLLDRMKSLSGEHFDGELTKTLTALGYDGIVATYPDGSKEYVAFRPEQIKSATDNNGNFDPANPDIRYRLSGTDAKGIPLFSARAIAKKVMAATGLNATVVNTEADLPADLQAQIKRDKATGRVAGVYHNGTAYLVAANLRDTKHAISVMLHEAIGHGGVKSVLGERIGKVMAEIYRDMPAAMRKELERRYAGQMASMSEADARVMIAEEYVAHLAETDPRHSIINRMVALLRQFIRDTFGKSAALKWTRNDLVLLLAEARTAARNGGRGPGGAARMRETAAADALAALPEVDAADESAFVASLKGDAATRSFANAMYKARGTESPFFKAWFGKSRMVDKQGQPIAFVHRSYGERDTFTDADLGKNTGTPTATLGHFLARKDVGNVDRYGPVVEQFYIRMEKPKVITQAQFEAMGDWSLAKVQAYRKTLMEQGHDGLYIQGLAWPVVFEGKNIKARRNQGTFDESASTRYSLAQTATAAFKRWFGDSKVREPMQNSKQRFEDMPPLAVYHSTDADFDAFTSGRETVNSTTFGDITTERHGVFFAENPKFAEGYGKGDGQRVMPVYLSIQNPIYLDEGISGEDLAAIVDNADGKIVARDFYGLPVDEMWQAFDGDFGKNFVDAAKAAGFDGAYMIESDPETGEAQNVWVAFEPEQIKSAIGNSGEFDGGNPDIRYSLNDEADTTEALRKLGLGGRDADGIIEQIRNMTLGDLKAKLSEWSTRSEEGIFDGLAGIKRAEEAVGVTDADSQGYVSARMATGIADVMHGVLHYAAPEWRDGVISGKADTRGVLEILGDLGQDNLTPWLAWLGGKRAQMLKAQGRENNLTDADIAELLAMGQGKEELFEKVYRDYAKTNEAVLDLAEGAGLIDKEARAKWATEYYVPFYRQDEAEGIFTAPRTKRGLSHQSAAIKALKGGTLPTNDLLTNMLTGWTKRIDAAMKNKALLEVVDNLQGSEFLSDESPRFQQVLISRSQIAQQIRKDRKALAMAADMLGLPEGSKFLKVANQLMKPENEGFEKLWTKVAPTDPDIIRVQRGGKNEYYRVNDESLLRGLKFMEGSVFNDPITRIGRTFKRLLTTGVTASPDFILRNFIRDAAHAWMINKDGFVLGKDSIKGMRDALREDQDYRDLMFAGGSFQGGYVHGTDPEASAQIIRRALEKKGFSKQQQDSYLGSLVNTPAKAAAMLGRGWQSYRTLGDKVENANRLSTYKAALAAGKSKRQAAFEAKDLMDYSLRGNFAAAQWFTDVVPFLNARLQGLYKLGRAMKDDKTVIAKEVALKGAYIALFSLLLAGINDDDERYQELMDWDKDMHWHIFLGDQHFRIPKPFELGLIFGTVPERLLHALTGTQDGGDLAKAVSNGVFQTLAFNPVPQFYQPIRELQANRNFFRDMPIEDMSDEGKLPEARFDERTSAIGRALGQVTGPTLGISPKQLDHLVQGYTGTLGGYVLGMSNLVAGVFDDAARPSARAGDLPVVKVLYQGDDVRSTKYQSEFYDMMREADQLHRTVKAYREEGRVDAAERLLESSRDKLKHRAALGMARQQLGSVRKQMDAVYRDTSMSGEAKRAKLDQLQVRSNQIAERIVRRAEGDF